MGDYFVTLRPGFEGCDRAGELCAVGLAAASALERRRVTKIGCDGQVFLFNPGRGKICILDDGRIVLTVSRPPAQASIYGASSPADELVACTEPVATVDRLIDEALRIEPLLGGRWGRREFVGTLPPGLGDAAREDVPQLRAYCAPCRGLPGHLKLYESVALRESSNYALNSLVHLAPINSASVEDFILRSTIDGEKLARYLIYDESAYTVSLFGGVEELLASRQVEVSGLSLRCETIGQVYDTFCQISEAYAAAVERGGC